MIKKMFAREHLYIYMQWIKQTAFPNTACYEPNVTCWKNVMIWSLKMVNILYQKQKKYLNSLQAKQALEINSYLWSFWYIRIYALILWSLQSIFIFICLWVSSPVLNQITWFQETSVKRCW